MLLKPYINFLAYSEEPQKADIIVIMGGSWIETIHHAYNLYKKNYAKKILVSGSEKKGRYWFWNEGKPISGCEWTRQYLIYLGVKPEDILKEDKPTSTYQEAREIKKDLERLKVKKAIITASIFHMRRVKMTYDKIFKNSDIKLNFVSLPEEIKRYKINKIWMDEDSMLALFNEGLKIIIYSLKLLRPVE